MFADFSSYIVVLLFVFILVASGRYFYCLELRWAARRLARKLGLDILNLAYSFEQIVYFVSLPSNIPNIRLASPENLVIKLDYRSLFFPRLFGLKMYLQTDKERIVLAYLPIKDFRLPALDKLQEEGKIKESDYLKMSTCKMIHPTTLKEISDEVFKQLQVGRNGRKAGAAEEIASTVNSL